MDTSPHTHRIAVKRLTGLELLLHIWIWEVSYGDTRVRAMRGSLLRRRIDRAMRRAVRKHDRGSVKARRAEALSVRADALSARLGRSEEQERERDYARYYGSVWLGADRRRAPEPAPKVWGSDILAGR